MAWTVPPTQDDPGGGGVQATPQSVAGNWAGNRIAVMQLTVTPNPGPGGVTIEGTFGALTVVGGNSTETQGNFTNFPPTPGTLAVLGLAALGCRRRRV